MSNKLRCRMTELSQQLGSLQNEVVQVKASYGQLKQQQTVKRDQTEGDLPLSQATLKPQV